MTHYTICAALTIYLHGSSPGLTDPFVSFMVFSSHLFTSQCTFESIRLAYISLHMYCTIYGTRVCVLYGFVRKSCPTITRFRLIQDNCVSPADLDRINESRLYVCLSIVILNSNCLVFPSSWVVNWRWLLPTLVHDFVEILCSGELHALDTGTWLDFQHWMSCSLSFMQLWMNESF